jgi:SAM-dependent methyltransferase
VSDGARSAGADAPVQQGSSSLRQQGYWWHRARTDLLGVVMRPHLGTPRRTLDVGSADAPSVGWMRGEQQHVSLDLLPEGLVPGEGVCGSATELPFGDATFDVVSAFDVVEHCADDARAIAELARVLVPGGRMLLSVPAYQWAWSDHDVQAGHHRRYTRAQVVELVEEGGMRVARATYAFTGVFPLFVAERLRRRVSPPPAGDTRLPQVSPRVDRVLMGLCAADARLLQRRDLPYGSSVLLAAVKPDGPTRA